MSELLEFLRTHEEAFRSRARLASLYSDFRYQRNTNPDGYQANSSAWIRALSRAAKAGHVPSSAAVGSDRFVLNTGEELLQQLQTQEYGRPLALGAVLEDAVRKKELVLLRDFLESRESIYKKSWLPTPWQVMTWSLRQLGVLGEGGDREDRLVRGQFVVVANVEAAAKTVIDKASKIATSNTSRIFSKDLFRSIFAPTLGVDSLSQNDQEVLLRHLQRDRSAIAYSETSGVIKFKSSTDSEPATITDEDVSIASLRTLISSIEPQIEQLTNQISQLDLKARTSVSNKQLIAAKTALRQKKASDTKLQQRTATLAQLEDVYAKIEQAADQVEIMKVMEASGQTLKSLNKQTGGVEKVQNVMDDIRNEMMNVDEIGSAINEVSAGEVDEGEVEDELEALEKAERQKQEAIEKTNKEVEEKAMQEKREKEVAEALADSGLKTPGEQPAQEQVKDKSKEREISN